MFRWSSRFLLVLAALALACRLSYAAPDTVIAKSLEADATWSGDLLIKSTVAVPTGVKLLIKEGTRLRFAPGTGLSVNGELVIEGSKENPVWLGPEKELSAQAPEESMWAGIQIINANPSRISYAHFEGAGWSAVGGTSVKINDTTFKKGRGGLKFTIGGRSKVANATFAQMTEGGINVSTGAAVEVFDSTFTDCGNFGVVNGQRGLVRVRGCKFDKCKTGVKLINDGSFVVENTFANCEVAISVLQSSNRLVVGKNKISGGDVGILCTQFASPQVVANEIAGAKEGIRCFQGSSPQLAHNRIEKCETAISCIQLCKPVIEKNQLFNNKVGVYLQTSSYAVVRQNNFKQNELHLKLGDMMSADWESRVTEKPTRALQARNEELVKLGRAVAEKLETKVATTGKVSAQSNWWGEATTAEMTEKGADADIAGLRDSFDVESVSYRGYEGQYKLDRIVYEDWLQAPVEDAGPEGFKPPKGADTEEAESKGPGENKADQKEIQPTQ